MSQDLERCGACKAEWIATPGAPLVCPLCHTPVEHRPIICSTGITVDAVVPVSRRSTVMVRDVPVVDGVPDKKALSDRQPTTGRLAGVAAQARRARAHRRTVIEGGLDHEGTADYAVTGALAHGGMGEVMMARQTSLDRDIALKRLPANHTDDEAHQRFFAEAVVTGNLDHPNIVPIHELGVDQEGQPFYVMKRIHGQPWSARLRRLSLDENLDVLMHVCDGVAFAHARGVLHRDLKPDNIMLGDFGEILVVDWGLAVEIDELQRDRTAMRLACGTPAYMAPEMAQGDYERLGPRSDVYLLGAILYEIITGVAPHPGEDPYEGIHAAAINRIEPMPPPGELGAIALKAMATDPGERYPDVKGLQAALSEYRSHAQSTSLADNSAEALRRARGNGSYDDYARALYGFEEAATLWPGNVHARDGAVEARRAYAERALEAGDLDLAGNLVADRGHDDLVLRVATARLRLRAARRRTLLLTIVSALLLLTVVITLGMAFLESRDLIKAMRARHDAERRLHQLQQEMGKIVFSENFDSGRLPTELITRQGRWLIVDQALVAQSPGRLSVLEMATPMQDGVRLEYDWTRPIPHRIHLCADSHEDLNGHDGVSVSFGADCVVRRADQVLAQRTMPPLVTDLSQQLSIERIGTTLVVRVDAVEMIRLDVGVAVASRQHLFVAAESGAVFDNLRIEYLIRKVRDKE